MTTAEKINKIFKKPIDFLQLQCFLKTIYKYYGMNSGQSTSCVYLVSCCLSDLPSVSSFFSYIF